MFQLIFVPVEFFPNKDFRTQAWTDSIPHESDYIDSIDELVSMNLISTVSCKIMKPKIDCSKLRPHPGIDAMAYDNGSVTNMNAQPLNVMQLDN